MCFKSASPSSKALLFESQLRSVLCSSVSLGLQKEQVGDMLHEVHAELLQVKKAQYEEEIDKKNKELQQLKLALEKIQILNFWKVSEDPSAPTCPSCYSPWSHMS